MDSCPGEIPEIVNTANKMRRFDRGAITPKVDSGGYPRGRIHCEAISSIAVRRNRRKYGHPREITAGIVGP